MNISIVNNTKGTDTIVIRASGAAKGAVHLETVSGVGICGWALFSGDGKIEAGEMGKIYEQEQEEGWLLRTKGMDGDEGGVAAGFSVLDSLLLVSVE